jgi:hypothetical protein
MVGSATTFVPAHYLLSFLFLGGCDLLLTKCGVKGGHWFALHALGNFYITVSRPHRAATPPRRRAPAPPAHPCERREGTHTYARSPSISSIR